MKQKLNLEGIGMTSMRTRERLIQRLHDEGISNISVLDIMRTTPRHIFVDEALAHRAYEDTALPIGHNQTISQPYIVALMTEALLAAGSNVKKVLEIGTGSGYQTAILAQLVDSVFTVERIKPLQLKAREKLRLLGLNNVQYKHDDGHWGWQEQGPFDGIITTASPAQVPSELLEQLADGGRLVIPVGNNEVQDLCVFIKNGDHIQSSVIEKVRFVPLLNGCIS